MMSKQRLSPDEKAPNYSFSDCENNEQDLLLLQGILRNIHKSILQPAKTITLSPMTYNYINERGFKYRIIIYNFQQLIIDQPLLFVGFISKKKQSISPEIEQMIAKMDKTLVKELAETPSLLSYSSLELPDGNWANLVLFNNEEGKEHVKTNSNHMYAAFHVGPQYYEWIRLHNGILSNGIYTKNNFFLKKTNYYFFRKNSFWFATRNLSTE